MSSATPILQKAPQNKQLHQKRLRIGGAFS
nr:MAG TPA_asm: hypothetical protein [Caudoviricetes sp.]